MIDKVRIVEVGPRDGLQNEATVVPSAAKIAFVNALSLADLSEIEVTSFVAPGWIPQLEDAEVVFAGISKHANVTYSALVPNLRGFERSQTVGVKKVAVFTAASETFVGKNINTSIDGSFQRFVPVITAARAAGVVVRGYVSTAFYCPYEGKIAADKVATVVGRLFDAGVAEVSIGDTIGKATLDDVDDLMKALGGGVDVSRLALHFHDTFGQAAANVVRAYEHGVRVFDASAGGLGGCPYAPAATGNVATQTVIRALRAYGANVEGDLDGIDTARALLPF